MSELAQQRRQIKRRVLNCARDQLGTREQPINLTKYGAWYNMNGQPWCAMFISWVAAHTGTTSIIPRCAYTPSGAAWFMAHLAWGHTPRVGAIVYYDLAGLGRISHTGIVEQVFPDGSWYAIEGNTNVAGSRDGGGVRRQKRTKVGMLGGFGYPDYTGLARRELAA